MTLIEQDRGLVEKLQAWAPSVNVMHGDACEPTVLEDAATATADVVVAATGDDEDNLVTSLLAKQEFAVPRALARVNHPRNEWLFTEQWGVDAAVSPPHILTAMVEEAVTVGRSRAPDPTRRRPGIDRRDDPARGLTLDRAGRVRAALAARLRHRGDPARGARGDPAARDGVRGRRTRSWRSPRPAVERELRDAVVGADVPGSVPSDPIAGGRVASSDVGLALAGDRSPQDAVALEQECELIAEGFQDPALREAEGLARHRATRADRGCAARRSAAGARRPHRRSAARSRAHRPPWRARSIPVSPSWTYSAPSRNPNVATTTRTTPS